MGLRAGLGALGNRKKLLYVPGIERRLYRPCPITPWNHSDILHSNHAIPAPSTPIYSQGYEPGVSYITLYIPFGRNPLSLKPQTYGCNAC